MPSSPPDNDDYDPREAMPWAELGCLALAFIAGGFGGLVATWLSGWPS